MQSAAAPFTPKQQPQQLQVQQPVAPMAPQVVAPAPSNNSANSVSVLVHGLPNNLCNSMCMEAIIEQAGLEDSIVMVEAWPGTPSGEAKISLTTWEAAELCVRHFHGCRWCSTGSSVRAEIDAASAPGMWLPGPSVVDAPAADTFKIQRDSEDGYSHRSSSRDSDKRFDNSWSKKAGQPSPLASPTLTAASTQTPPSPSPDALGSPLMTPSSRRETLAFRKTSTVSWADLLSDDEEEEEDSSLSTNLENDQNTDSGSAGVGTSDDGF
jgi:hypothetical protein